ncbi:type IV secretion system protein [Campylobacter sp.]|uniref:type IV secretion system protein n=1 Tax=Campylobacter sp. TaxID=205 RepID=UPI002A747320|nr:type IV secretion system protein [Campylobacter sp.]MDY3246358.1 type IV secretion system protein [Campylobacter sp.]
MKITKSLIGATLAINLSFGSGIPVVDASANAQMIRDSKERALTWAKEAKRWADTVEQYKKDLEAQAKELATKTGIRDAMKFAKDIKGIYDTAKNLGTSIQDSVNSFDLSKLDNQAYGLLTKTIGDDPCKGYSTLAATNACKKMKVSPWKESIAIGESAKNLQKFSKRLEDLSDEIAKDKGDQEDVKSSTDMSNQINLTIAQLQAEKARIDLQLANLQRDRERAKRIETERLKKAQTKAPFNY